jgi:hypothetical protein
MRRNRLFAVLPALAALTQLAACSSGPGNGISGLVVGTGYSPSQHAATGLASDFSPGQSVYAVFTVQSPASGAVVEVTLLRNGSLEGTSLPIKASKGRAVYDEPVALGGPGTVMIDVSYNGAVQQTALVTVG